MKKVLSQISLILLIIIIGLTSVFINQANAASQAGLNVSSATEGETFTVGLIFPGHYANIYGATATVTVTYSDNSQATERLVYFEGMKDYPNYVTFTAKVAGSAKIEVTQIDITDTESVLIEEGETKTETITIAAKTPEPATPTPDENETSSEKDNSSDKNNSNTTTNTITTTNTTVDNTTKEPEVKNPTFKEVNETVYALKGANVRSSCSTEISSNKIGGIVKGQAVKRTGVEDTWSRIEFNGKTAYVATRLLTTEEPVKEEPENTVTENAVDKNEIENTIENNIVENTIVDNVIDSNEISNDELLNQIEQEIGVLPEVGHNIATTMFIIISIFSLIIIMRLQYKSKE